MDILEVACGKIKTCCRILIEVNTWKPKSDTQSVTKEEEIPDF